MVIKNSWRIAIWVLGFVIFFAAYSYGLSRNPPGFYVDESGLAYNAYLVSHTGAGEFGPRFPLYVEFYTNGFTQYASPTQIYLLALVFRFLPPSILLVRLFSALWVFTACVLLGLLAKRISGKPVVAAIVFGIALLTPWFFDARGLVMEPHFVPLATTLFLFVLYRAQASENWNWTNAAAIAATLALLTYCYTSGRILGLLFAGGLILFATARQRLIGVAKTWLLYGVTLAPFVVFNLRHPGLLTRRLYEISYIRLGMPWSEIASQFVRRYLEDQSLNTLLFAGDYHARHHVQGSGGAILLATFLLAVFGLMLIISRRLREPWWRFVLFGLFASIVPGAISNEPFHQLRLLAYPVFLLLLTIPTIEWLVASNPPLNDVAKKSPPWSSPDRLTRSTRLGILAVVLIFTIGQAVQYQIAFRKDGPKREFDFDVSYKAAYDAAVMQPSRPIYLEDGFWGPAYIHAFWYATIEGRPTTEFVHLEVGTKPPSGVVVISSEQNCANCEIIKRSGVYLLYESK